jgi:formate hydrogenlyase subunit 3/multisubunit Na+/H+ antiporter MnhD subunit
VIREYIKELNPGVSPMAALVTLVSSVRGMSLEWILGAIAMAGLILAWWKEGLGGGISLVCFIWLSFQLSSDHFNGFILATVIIVSVPCVLYLVYWWKRSRYQRKSGVNPPVI